MKRIFLLIIFVVCFFALSSCSECKHKEKNIVVDSAILPTCIEDGLTEGSHCGKCGVIVVKQETISATGHKWNDGTITTEPTCTEAGSKSYHCTVCGEKTDITIIEAMGHKWNNGAIPTEPTCTESGIKIFVCDSCAAMKIEELTANGHTWNAGTVTINPTCIQKGVKTFECDSCGATKTEKINASGHSYATEWTIDLAPTCTEAGSKSHHCTVCGNKTDITTVEATGHKWNDGTITAEPTCTESGVKTFECGSCGATMTKDVRAAGHSYSSAVTNKTCADNGKIIFTCDICNDNYEENISSISVSIAHVGTSSSTVNGYGMFSLSYRITVSGGYGTVYCKTELYNTSSSSSVSEMDYTDFSNANYQVSYTGYDYTINDCYLLITAKDDANNITVCKVDLGSTTIMEQYVQDDHNYSDVDDKCTICGKLIDYTEGLRYELINNDTEYAVTSIGSATDADIIIPRTYNEKPVTAIGESAFEKCSTIKNVRLHSGITSVGEKAFYFSSLSSIQFLIGLETIGYQAFSGCNLVGEITLPDSITFIDKFAFCYNDFTKFVFSKGITTIDTNVLWNCRNLTTIIIPNTITDIKYQAFWSCVNLNSIEFEGTIAEWTTIVKETGWDNDTGNYTIHCTDGDLTKAEAY